ncbi:MAG: response regulator transcription factor [Deltaproteobacteria bacterium]|nr:response regulator transcription factor [Deltaproteobacteria bacterium]
MSIRVLLADDHTIMRQGLMALLKSEKDMEVIAEAANGLEAIHLARELTPCVIVMDMTMPEVNGIEATRQILEYNPDIRIIILSMVMDQSCVAEALKAGAMGYVLKDCASDELVVAIHTTMGGFPYLCREVTALVIKDYTQKNDRRPCVLQSPLSRRELDVLRLVADGKNSKEMAFQFNVSVKTIEAQRMNIMKKLNIYSVAELTKYAVREGLTGIE